MNFDLVLGVVPDYMYGILIGATKLLLGFWLNSVNHEHESYVGKHIAYTINQHLTQMKRPSEFVRMPKDLVRNNQHLKASEYQTILLFSLIPCFGDVLPDEFLRHTLLLSEGTYLLLKDKITAADLV